MKVKATDLFSKYLEYTYLERYRIIHAINYLTQKKIFEYAAYLL